MRLHWLAKTREYVAAVIAEDGGSREVRLTAPVLKTRMKKISESLGGAGVLRKVRTMGATLEPAERQQITAEVENLRAILQAIVRELRGR